MNMIDYIINHSTGKTNLNKKKYPDKTCLKYCDKCKSVYELHMKKTLRYHDFPTYGLKRKDCGYCEKGKCNQKDLFQKIGI